MLRNELHPKGFELVTVGLDTLGNDGCRASIEAAKPEHPSLIDRHHVLADLFGVTNIPQGVWIDEQGMIVRPAETAPAPSRAPPPPPPPGTAMPAPPPQRMIEIMTEAAKIRMDAAAYHAALRDWVENGAASRFALSPDQVIERSRPRDADHAIGHAHFALASELEIRGDHENAIHHFRQAHKRVPESWTFRRQAWSLEQSAGGPMSRFWQGPDPSDPKAWPYAGDWLKDIRKSGAENYYEPWVP
jgi:hypothetical protein